MRFFFSLLLKYRQKFLLDFSESPFVESPTVAHMHMVFFVLLLPESWPPLCGWPFRWCSLNRNGPLNWASTSSHRERRVSFWLVKWNHSLQENRSMWACGLWFLFQWSMFVGKKRNPNLNTSLVSFLFFFSYVAIHWESSCNHWKQHVWLVYLKCVMVKLPFLLLESQCPNGLYALMLRRKTDEVYTVLGGSSHES